MASSRPNREWEALVGRMVDELREQQPRTDTYWAQQLAFGPVLVHALALAVRWDEVAAEDKRHLCRVVDLAVRGLGALPDHPGVDVRGLAILARRQAVALASGRRRHLGRLAARLGLRPDEAAYAPVLDRMLRPYPLLGWSPFGATAHGGSGDLATGGVSTAAPTRCRPSDGYRGAV